MEIKEALITVAQKLGIDNPEILQKLQSIEGEIEDEDGTFEQGIQELVHIDEVLAENPKNEKLKSYRAKIKAESFGGFEKMVLDAVPHPWKNGTPKNSAKICSGASFPCFNERS